REPAVAPAQGRARQLSRRLRQRPDRQRATAAHRPRRVAAPETPRGPRSASRLSANPHFAVTVRRAYRARVPYLIPWGGSPPGRVNMLTIKRLATTLLLALAAWA